MEAANKKYGYSPLKWFRPKVQGIPWLQFLLKS